MKPKITIAQLFDVPCPIDPDELFEGLEVSKCSDAFLFIGMIAGHEPAYVEMNARHPEHWAARSKQTFYLSTPQ